MRIRGVTEEQIRQIATGLGLKLENPRWQGRFFCFVLRVAKSRMDRCSARYGQEQCTRKVHKGGQHLVRDEQGRIEIRWPADGWVDPAYRFRKRGYHAYLNGSDSHGGNGAVCFHGHKRFMEAIFAINPMADILTKMAQYRGLERFKELFPRVEDSNVGSQMYPLRYGDACDCDPSDEHEITFGTLRPPKHEGDKAELTNVRMIRQGDLKRCPFTIFSAEHYREDGSCKCDDAEHRKFMISHWEYKQSDFDGIPLRRQA